MAQRPRKKKKKRKKAVSGQGAAPMLPARTPPPVPEPVYSQAPYQAQPVYPAEAYYPNYQQGPDPNLLPSMILPIFDVIGQMFQSLALGASQNFTDKLANVPTTTNVNIQLKDGRILSASLSNIGPMGHNTAIQQVLDAYAPGATLQDVVASSVITVGQSSDSAYQQPPQNSWQQGYNPYTGYQ